MLKIDVQNRRVWFGFIFGHTYDVLSIITIVDIYVLI